MQFKREDNLICSEMGIRVSKVVILSVKLSSFLSHLFLQLCLKGAQWLSGRVLDSRPRGRGFEAHLHRCVVSLSKTHLS